VAVLTIAKDAPAGPKQAEIELEITNFHVSPGVSLAVTVPLSVN
jgi:hypothetical protein